MLVFVLVSVLAALVPVASSAAALVAVIVVFVLVSVLAALVPVASSAAAFDRIRRLLHLHLRQFPTLATLAVCTGPAWHICMALYIAHMLSAWVGCRWSTRSISIVCFGTRRLPCLDRTGNTALDPSRFDSRNFRTPIPRAEGPFLLGAAGLRIRI